MGSPFSTSFFRIAKYKSFRLTSQHCKYSLQVDENGNHVTGQGRWGICGLHCPKYYCKNGIERMFFYIFQIIVHKNIFHIKITSNIILKIVLRKEAHHLTNHASFHSYFNQTLITIVWIVVMDNGAPHKWIQQEIMLEEKETGGIVQQIVK